MNRRFDVAVVGAGPAGSTAARICAQSGLSTVLIEEQAHIGYPVQCAGLLSTNAFSECQVSSSSVLNKVAGADIHAGTATCSFDAGRTMAYVVDRGILDREMAWSAADAGSEIRLKTIATGLSPGDHLLHCKGIHGREDLKYSILLAADGPRSSIARSLGISRAPVYLSGLQCDVRHETIVDHVQIFPNASPEFFGWIIPMNNEHARIGLCGITNVREKFSSFIRPFQDKCTHFVSGTIPLGTLPRTYDDGVMILGDAAAFAKPTSGGGVYTGVRSARHASELAIGSIEQGDTSYHALSMYERLWSHDFGREIGTGFSAFKLRQQIDNHDMEKIVRKMGEPAIRDLIVSKGDMDRPTRLMFSLLLQPRMFSAHCLVGKAFIRSVMGY